MDAYRPTPGSVRRFAAVAIAIAALIVSTIGPVDAATVTVAAVNFEFKPASVAVKVGDTVRWTFSGDPHTVTSGSPGSPDGRFNSDVVNPGGSFQFTFTAAGTFRYFCQIHSEQMFGTIVVSAGSSATPTPRPTAKPTAKPTARPTVKPTAKPTATAAATASATASPTASPATPSPATPTASALPSPTPTGSSTGSIGPGSASASPSGGPDDQGAASVSPAAILGALVVLVLIGGGALLAARRARPA